MPHPVRQLSIGQRFRLGILCEEFEQAVADAAAGGDPSGERERAAVVAGTASIVRYLAGERVGWRAFTANDQEDYRPAYYAAVLLRHRRDYDAGTLAFDILAAAGLRPSRPARR